MDQPMFPIGFTPGGGLGWAPYGSGPGLYPGVTYGPSASTHLEPARGRHSLDSCLAFSFIVPGVGGVGGPPGSGAPVWVP
jgi:hypothetical protein